MHIALVGPCAPGDIADLVAPSQSGDARTAAGKRGVPVSELAAGLVEAGHDVTVCTLDFRADAVPLHFTGPRFRFVSEPARHQPRRYLSDLYARERGTLVAALREWRPDLVHAHWTYEFALAAQDSLLPYVTTAHDAPLTILRHARDPYRAVRLAVAARARLGVKDLSVVSPYLVHRWRREMLFRRRIAVIPNSVPRTSVAKHRSPSDHPIVLEVAEHGPLKNVRGLLRAFALVRQQIPEAELRLAGHGLGPNGPVVPWAVAHGLSLGVSFLGYREPSDLADEYARAWLFAHASHEESFGLTVLEAIASGLPAVAGKDSGGVRYVLGDGRAGWLTDVSRPEVFAKQIAQLIAGGPLDQQPGTTEYVQKNFSLESVTCAYLGWYRAVLDRGTSR